MFIYNIKVNGSKLFKIFFTAVVFILICILGIVMYRVFSGANNSSSSSCLPPNGISQISAKNYTNILKTVHENIDNYVGKKFEFTGYIYRVSDLKDNQFILARDMVVSSDYQSVIVGFLCEYDQAKNFENHTWVHITGEITKGDYHGDMPIVKILRLETTDKPNEELVYPPDETYIPTSTIL